MSQPSFGQTFVVVAIEMAVLAPVFFAVVFGGLTIAVRILAHRPAVGVQPQERAGWAQCMEGFATATSGIKQSVVKVLARTPALSR